MTLLELLAARCVEIQAAMLAKALAFRETHTSEPADYAEFKRAVETGFARSFWCGGAACEAKIKEETKATMRCIPLDQAAGEGKCIFCGASCRRKEEFSPGRISKTAYQPYGRQKGRQDMEIVQVTHWVNQARPSSTLAERGGSLMVDGFRTKFTGREYPRR